MSIIYYSDFEANTTVSPHGPYLHCTAYHEDQNSYKVSFEGENNDPSFSITWFKNINNRKIRYDSPSNAYIARIWQASEKISIL